MPPISVVVAGGGTAGHIEPALAVADAVLRAQPDARVTALGTTRGLETELVPARGFDLRLIEPVPVPRKPSIDLLKLPYRVIHAVAQTRRHLTDVGADVLIGFGGYVSAPAYLAAKAANIPFFVHEANASAGMANKLGIRLGGTGLCAVANCGIPADVVGIPVRPAIATLDRAAQRPAAREEFGLPSTTPVLLVTGGSQGAKSINRAVVDAVPHLLDAGISVLHAYGKKNADDVAGAPTHRDASPARYIALPYLDNMDRALAAADMILCRSGAMTVAEVTATGLPACYVPLPHGNGEQALNATPIVDAGGALLIPDSELSADTIRTRLIPILRDASTRDTMEAATRGTGFGNAADLIASRLLAAAHSRH